MYKYLLHEVRSKPDTYGNVYEKRPEQEEMF